jgi:TPR repeat protein
MYEEGSNAVPKDLENALFHYMEAFEHGISGAAYRIACIYNEGELPEGRDIKKTLEWYIKADAQGDLDAADDLLGMSLGGMLYPEFAEDLIQEAISQNDRRVNSKTHRN